MRDPAPADDRRAIGGNPAASGRTARLSGRPGHGEAPCMTLDLEALETSFDLVAPRGDELMDIFYTRLFAAAPAVKPLFAGSDLRRQKTMLLGTLVLLRKSLRNLDAIVPKLRELGARHVAYGAQPAHYPVVGEALIAAMADVAGEAWRPEYERAWAAAFDVVAGAMLDGAASAPLAAAA
jgi:hemoglobin-like flavoprotein